MSMRYVDDFFKILETFTFNMPDRYLGRYLRLPRPHRDLVNSAVALASTYVLSWRYCIQQVEREASSGRCYFW